MAAKGSFSTPSQTHTFAGFLLDMDGTIIDSTDAIVKHWHKLAVELGFDADVLLATSHGRRSIDTLKVVSPEKANWDYISRVEGLIPVEYGADASEIPGARGFLAALQSVEAPWAIVTSGTRALMNGWLSVMKLPPPPISVVAEEVEEGKPEPGCYLLGRKRIGVKDGEEVLVVEDAPSGVKAGKAAHCKVLGLATTHTVESIRAAGADWVVQDLRSVRIRKSPDGSGWQIDLSDVWKQVS